MNNNEDLKYVFNYLDVQSKGSINKSDLFSGIKYLGIANTINDFNRLIADYSDDISFDNFIEIVNKAKNIQITKNDILDAFEGFADSGTDSINTKEFFRLLSVSGDKLSSDDISQFMKLTQIKSDSTQFNYKTVTDEINQQLMK